MARYRTGNHWGVTIVREGETPAEVVHHMPYANSGLVTCCARPPFELPRTDRMTGDRASVTCANRDGDELVAVVVNGDQTLAERICALLNGEPCRDRVTGLHLSPCTCLPVAAADMSDLALRFAATKVRAIRPGVEPQDALAVIRALVVLGWQPPPLGPERTPEARP